MSDYPTYLVHFGIKGQKWGNRRYQNEDGSLTSEGKIRYGYDKNTGKISKAGMQLMNKDKKFIQKYVKLRNKAIKDYKRDYNKNYIKAYNKSADYMNNKGINDFNKEQEKKYGKKYAERKDYMSNYMKNFNKIINKNYDDVMSEWYHNNTNFKKAANLIKKYGKDFVEDKNDIKMFEKYKLLQKMRTKKPRLPLTSPEPKKPRLPLTRPETKKRRSPLVTTPEGIPPRYKESIKY